MASHVNNKLVSLTISVRDEIKITQGNEVITDSLSPLAFRSHDSIFTKSLCITFFFCAKRLFI